MLKSNWRKTVLIGFVGIAALVSGCRYDMQDQPRHKEYRGSDFFGNGMSSRPFVEGTVARGFLREDKALYTGKKEGVSPTTAPTTTAGATANPTYPDMVTEFPIPVTKELIDRGEERYKVFCIVCHGPNGDANGMVVRRGFSPPPSYHIERLRNAPVGYFFDVITNGFGRMNSYASQIPVADRWAIVAYIRTLQASKNPDVTNPQTKTNQTAPQNTNPQPNPQANTNGGTHQ
jgi:hypothetical protein